MAIHNKKWQTTIAQSYNMSEKRAKHNKMANHNHKQQLNWQTHTHSYNITYNVHNKHKHITKGQTQSYNMSDKANNNKMTNHNHLNIIKKGPHARIKYIQTCTVTTNT